MENGLEIFKALFNLQNGKHIFNGKSNQKKILDLNIDIYGQWS